MNFYYKKVLLAHHWSFYLQRHPIFAQDELYLTSSQHEHPKVFNVPIGSSVDMGQLVKKLPSNWYPDLFIAKVDSFFNIIPRNVETLKCPKVLILGDTQHGNDPLNKMIEYAKSEKYDFYITDHKRHHLWYYWLAGITNLYWLPGLFLNPPNETFNWQEFQDPKLDNKFFQGKAIFVGQAGKYHPRRKRILQYASDHLNNFWWGQLNQRDSLKAFAAADTALNVSLNGDLNLRIFEILSAKGFLLTDQLTDESGINLLLNEGEEYESFANASEMIDKIKYFSSYPDLISKYRQKGHTRYLKEYSPEKMIAVFNDLLQGNTIENRFTTKSINRIQYCQDTEFSRARISLYQVIQELHQKWENLEILLDARIKFTSVADFLDLPRVNVTLTNYEDSYVNNLESYLRQSGHLNRVNFVKNAQPDQRFNIIITSVCDINLISQLQKCEAIIISKDYQGLRTLSQNIDFSNAIYFRDSFFIIYTQQIKIYDISSQSQPLLLSNKSETLSALIITGMHRSGTSLIASLLQSAGLNIGQRLLEASPANRKGYYENLDFLELHKEILRSHGIEETGWTFQEKLNVEAPYIEKAKKIIAKNSASNFWGWKDPRTTLFLDFWADLIPNSKFCFVYRSPWEVVDSLYRRGDLSFLSNPTLAIQMWIHYNQIILSFYKRKPENCLIVSPYNVINKPDHLINLINNKFDINLNSPEIENCDKKLLHNEVSNTNKPALISHYFPEALELYRELLEIEANEFKDQASYKVLKDDALSVISNRHPIGNFEDWRDIRHLENKNLALQREVQKLYSQLQGNQERHRYVFDNPTSISTLHQGQPVICIVKPNENAYSETFIRAHLERLPANVKAVSGVWFSPNQDRSKLKQFILQNKVDAVLAEFGPAGVAVMEVCQEVEVPLIVHFHGFDAYHKGLIQQVGQYYPKLFEKASATIAVSKDMKRQLLNLGAPQEKLYYNPYGVDLSFFQAGEPAHTQPIFLAIGRFVDKKAPHLTLLAFKEVFKTYPEARLIMIGDGSLWESCKQLAHTLGIADAVEFKGSCSHSEVATAMRKARAFVQHSMQTSYGDSEGTPVAVLEAGASGLPVVATRHAGIQDVVIDGETGLLVDEGDLQGMAKCMLQLVENPKLAARLGKAAQERISAQFSMEKSISRLWEIIEIAIQEDKDNKFVHNLDLRETNLIIFPDWNVSEETLLQELGNTLNTISNHPKAGKITLLLDLKGISQEDADLALSSAVMNLMMEEGIELREDLEISPIPELSDRAWEILLANVNGRIVLETENRDRVTEIGADQIPAYTLNTVNSEQFTQLD